MNFDLLSLEPFDNLFQVRSKYTVPLTIPKFAFPVVIIDKYFKSENDDYVGGIKD